MAKNILTDTGFWIGYCNLKDRYTKNCNELMTEIRNDKLFIPWPVLYETVGTRLTRRFESMQRFKDKLDALDNDCFISDVEFRDDAFIFCKEQALKKGGHFSLVDSVIRMIIESRKYNINRLFTVDSDFDDLQYTYGIEIIRIPPDEN